MAIMTRADITAFAGTIFTDAVFIARDQNLMTNLVTVFRDKTNWDPRSSAKYNSVTINSLGESDDMVSQQLTDSIVSTLTPGEFGAQYFLTDQRLESDRNNIRNNCALELGMGMAQKVETSLLGDFTSLTGGTVGAAGSTMTWGYFFAALTVLRAQKAPFPYHCVLHPYQYHALAKAAAPAQTVTNAPEFQNEIMRQWWVGRVGPVDLFVTANLSINASDDAYGAIFNPLALAYDERRAPRLEVDRDPSRRGWELNYTSVFKTGVWRPEWGVQLLTDATAPTS